VGGSVPQAPIDNFNRWSMGPPAEIISERRSRLPASPDSGHGVTCPERPVGPHTDAPARLVQHNRSYVTIRRVFGPNGSVTASFWITHESSPSVSPQLAVIALRINKTMLARWGLIHRNRGSHHFKGLALGSNVTLQPALTNEEARMRPSLCMLLRNEWRQNSAQRRV
jgi:hypothetical protein